MGTAIRIKDWCFRIFTKSAATSYQIWRCGAADAGINVFKPIALTTLFTFSARYLPALISCEWYPTLTRDTGVSHLSLTCVSRSTTQLSVGNQSQNISYFIWRFVVKYDYSVDWDYDLKAWWSMSCKSDIRGEKVKNKRLMIVVGDGAFILTCIMIKDNYYAGCYEDIVTLSSH